MQKYFVYRHADRESEPKDYDICNSEERNLLTCTYNRIGNDTDGVRIIDIL